MGQGSSEASIRHRSPRLLQRPGKGHPRPRLRPGRLPIRFGLGFDRYWNSVKSILAQENVQEDVEVGGKTGRSGLSPYLRALSALVSGVSGRPWTTILLTLLLTILSVVYSGQNLRMNSDDSALISQDEPFRREYSHFIDVFPQFDETTVIVLTSESLDIADDAADRLTQALAKRPDLIHSLYSPSATPFFEDHALLYMDEEDLEEVIDRLAEAQPALAALAEDPSLRGLFDQLQLSLEELLEEGEELPSGFSAMTDRVSDVIQSLLDGRPQKISWADEFLPQEGQVYRIIIIQGHKDFSEDISTRRLIDEIRAMASSLGLSPENGVKVRLTGMVPLANDELESLQSGLSLAGGLSLSLLVVILGFGVRSLRIIVATLFTLITSILWTTAWAMASVGEFNIISAAFAVLMIGIGVDFAIHIGLRYEEETRRGLDVRPALVAAAEATGPSVSLCALTSAIGFLAFVPTPYPGLAALGIIAGGGMFLSLIASFTLFPAILATMRPPSGQQVEGVPVFAGLYSQIERRATGIVVAAGLIGLAAIAISTQASFDFSTLSMRDPESESMLTLRELQEEDIVTDYSATVLAPDVEGAEQLAAELEALEVVSEARPPGWYVAGNQEEKLFMIEDAAFFLESILNPPPSPVAPTPAERVAVVEELHRSIDLLPPGHDENSSWRSARRLGGMLDLLLARGDVSAAVGELESLVVNDLEERIEWIGRAVTVREVQFEDLPASLRARSVAADGRAIVVALPREDVRDPDALQRFVDTVATVAPHATGRPVVEAGIGQVVVMTFRIAIGLSLLAVSLVLFLALGSLVDAITVLLPITLAALMTTAFGVLIEMPFNMTNVVVIPLIMGLGIDNGIHVFMRFQGNASVGEMMSSSTPRAVLLSALTTLAAFGSLAVSGHRGLHTMGVLLSVSVIGLILCTLVVLPAILILFRRSGREDPRPT